MLDALSSKGCTTPVKIGWRMALCYVVLLSKTTSTPLNLQERRNLSRILDEDHLSRERLDTLRRAKSFSTIRAAEN